MEMHEAAASADGALGRHERKLRAELSSIQGTPMTKDPRTMSEAVELEDVIAFLKGEAPLDGYWFGDTVPATRGAYWWRDALRKAWNRRANHGEVEPVACPACDRGEVFGLSTDDGFWVEMGASAGGANEHGMNGWLELIEHHPDGTQKRREYVATDSPLYTRPVAWPDREAVARVIYASVHHLMRVSGAEAETAYECAAGSILALFPQGETE